MLIMSQLTYFLRSSIQSPNPLYNAFYRIISPNQIHVVLAERKLPTKLRNNCHLALFVSETLNSYLNPKYNC